MRPDPGEHRQLIAAGAVLLDEYQVDGDLDHLTLSDPEGNEFCIV